jgi:hypothetical protein
MIPYSEINIGDVFKSPAKWTGSNITYTVVSKKEGLIELRSSYQHPSLPETFWRKNTDRIFNQRRISKGSGNCIKANNKVSTNAILCFSDSDFEYEFEIWHHGLDHPEYDLRCPHREWEKKAYVAGCKRVFALMNNNK